MTEILIKQQFVNQVNQMIDRYSGKNIAGINLIKVLGLNRLDTLEHEAIQSKIMQLSITTDNLTVLRIMLKGNMKIENKDVRKIILLSKELFNKHKAKKYSTLDFIFDEDFILVGIVPLADNLEEEKLFYYDSSELWFDLYELQYISDHLNKTIKESINDIKDYKSKLIKYLYSVYGQYYTGLNPYNDTTLIIEYKMNNRWSYTQTSIDEIVKHYNSKRLRMCDRFYIYINLPGTYVPGKFIDIGYYNWIGSQKFNLNAKDHVLVIGYGSGIDLIHCLRRVDNVVGIELNIFGVATTLTNVKIYKRNSRATIMWGDIKEYLINTKGLKKSEKYNKIIWNLPYESTNTTVVPNRLKDFYDNYPVLKWFVPLIEQCKGRVIVEDFVGLFWKINDGKNEVEEAFSKYGYQYISSDEDNVCMISKKII